ncbi:MAG: ComEA family DNA-binding protein [Hominenteromicrobium sp.]
MKSGLQRTLLLAALFLVGCGLVFARILTVHQVLQPYRIVRTAAQTDSGVLDTETDRININTASAEDLMELPGIGTVLAARILAYREENGAFHDIGELQEVEGIGSTLLEKLKPYIFAE